MTRMASGWAGAMLAAAMSVAAWAEDPATQSAKRELDAIRKLSQEFVSAFNKGDAKAVAAHWTPDGEMVDEDGTKFAGRDAIAREYAVLFQTHPKVKLQILVDSLKLLSDSAAIEEGRTMLDPQPAGAPAYNKYLAIHVKRDGKWYMSTVRDTRVEVPSGYRHVADLEWLIGTWTAEEHGAKTVSTCRWIANKSFVERRYVVTAHDGTTTSGLQIIGWNPLAGRIQSWTFAADGGHATGDWAPIEGGWSAEVRGATGDGSETTSRNVLRRLDDGAYVWQSTERTLDGRELPDSDEIVMKRSSK